ncbi:MAG: response regulator [Cyanobacteria bacterium J06639_14]
MAHILILEDEISLSAYWRELLEWRGHQVTCCTRVDQAMKQLQSTDFDLIITDMVIKAPSAKPSPGGLSLISNRAIGKMPRVPILGVSGYRPSSQAWGEKLSLLEIAKEMGADLTLYKPISPEALMDAVDTLLNQAHTDDA